MKAVLLSPDWHSHARQFPHAYFCIVGVSMYILFLGLLSHLILVHVACILAFRIFLLVMAIKWSPPQISSCWFNFSFNAWNLGCFQSFTVRNIFAINIVFRLLSQQLLMCLLEWDSLPKSWKWYQLIKLRVLRTGVQSFLRQHLILWLISLHLIRRYVGRTYHVPENSRHWGAMSKRSPADGAESGP